MQWPQITILACALFVVLATSFLHGKPRGNFNVANTVISVGLELFILYAGGFFK